MKTELNFKGAGVFLHNENKVLLVLQRESKMWSLPKGSKNENEKVDECWKRELEEETGITYIPIHKTIEKFNILNYHITDIEILSSTLPYPKIKNYNKEIIKAIWVDINKLGKFKFNAITKPVIQNFCMKKKLNIKML